MASEKMEEAAEKKKPSFKIMKSGMKKKLKSIMMRSKSKGY